jgi:hypothetical protein
MSRDAIVNVLNLYSAALDSHSWDLFDQVFTADMEAGYPAPEWHWFDLASFKRDFKKYHEALGGHQHILTNHQVIERGDTAFSLTYGKYWLFQAAANGGRMNEGGCWYDDQLVRTADGWRIKKRVARVFWHRLATPDGGVMPEAVVLHSLPAEAKAGRIAYYNALRQKT